MNCTAQHRNYLALDFGASSGKLHSACLEGDTLHLAELARTEHQAVRNGRGQLVWQLDKLLEWLFAELKKLGGASEGASYRSIGVDTWGVDYVLLDAKGQRLSEPYSYRDERTQGAYEKIAQYISREELYQRTGSQFMEPNTLCQLFAAMEQEAEILSEVKHVLLMPSYFAYQLCQKPTSFYNEATMASTSQMYSSKLCDWDKELLQKFGFPVILLQALDGFVPIGTVLSPHLRPELATGGLADCAVRQVTSHDSAAALVAVPFRSEQGKLFISSGTWSVMGLELEQPITSAEALAGNFANELGYGDSIRFLKSLAGLWLIQELRRELAADCSYNELEQLLLREAQPFASLFPVSHPDLLRSEMMAEKIQQLCQQVGQLVPQTTAALLRSCYDSLALEYRHCYELLKRLSGQSIERVHIVGGGSQSILLNQLCADMLGLPTEAGPIEATAIGNILTQILADGVCSSLSEARQILCCSFVTREFLPTLGQTQRDALYQKYLQISEELL